MTYDLANSLSATQLLDPATSTATVTSATLDRNFTIGAAMLMLTMGESETRFPVPSNGISLFKIPQMTQLGQT